MSKQSDELAQIADKLELMQDGYDVGYAIMRLRKLSKWFKGLDDTAHFLKTKTNELETECEALRQEVKCFDVDLKCAEVQHEADQLKLTKLTDQLRDLHTYCAALEIRLRRATEPKQTLDLLVVQGITNIMREEASNG